MGIDFYPIVDTFCGCAEVKTGTIIVIVVSLIRACGPVLYLLMPVCRNVHGGDAMGYVLLTVKILELITTTAHVIIAILLLSDVISRWASNQERLADAFVWATFAVVVSMLLYWLLHFIAACINGCTFCTKYTTGNTNAGFEWKNGYSGKLCKKWDNTNKLGLLLMSTFLLWAMAESAMLLYFAAVVNTLYLEG